MSSTPTAEFVIGSGAGDGPLAVRLAAAGHSVLVLEAGELTSGLVYGVPALHAFASESEDMSWNFFVSITTSTTLLAAACSTRVLPRSVA